MANDTSGTPKLTASDESEGFFFWVKVILGTLALSSVVFGHRWVLTRIAAFRLSTRRMNGVVVHDGRFIARHTKQAELLAALKSPNNETVFVYGQRGSGKSSLIRHALMGRPGVIEIKISKKTADDASAELVKEVSKRVDLFGMPQDNLFLEDMFAACWVQPIVVVSLESRCNGEVLEGVLTACKILSYESSRKTCRFLINLSGSRAAFDASIQLSDLRCVGVHVGNFSTREALDYVTERVPTSFSDATRRNKISQSVVEIFDGRVLTLQRVCTLLREGKPGDMHDVTARMKKENENQIRKAASGWMVFCKKVAEELGTSYDAAAVEELVAVLLKGPQNINDVAVLLSRKSDTVPLSPREIGLFNADAGYHPLVIDPFETEVSFSGKAIVAALSKKSN